MGSDKAKQRWVEEKVETLLAGVKCLALFLRALSQTDYVGLTISLQQYWQFVKNITPSFGTLFAPLEAALRVNFLSSLLGGRREEVANSLHKRITWGVKREGIGILYPTQTAPAIFETSYHLCEFISTSLLNGEALYLRSHST